MAKKTLPPETMKRLFTSLSKAGYTFPEIDTLRTPKNLDKANMRARLADIGFTRDEIAALRRISMTLRHWFELECGTDAGAIERGGMQQGDFPVFVSYDDGKPFMRAEGRDGKVRHFPIADRETGARKRLATIMASHKRRAVAYVQTDPRGCAIYIIPLKDWSAYKTRHAAQSMLAKDYATKALKATSWQSSKPDLASIYSSIGVAVY